MKIEEMLKIEQVKHLLEESERLYLGRDEAVIPGHNFIRRYFIYSFPMVLKGLDFFMKEAMTFFIVYFSMMYGYYLLVRDATRTDAMLITDFLFPFLILVPVFVALFLPPTAYSDSRIRPSLINKLVKEIKSKKYNLKRAKELLEVFNIRSQKRVLFLKRLYALLWAGFIYIFKESGDANIETLSVFKSGLIPLTGYFILLAVGVLFIEAYSKSTDIIFTSVEIALNEIEE